MLLLYNVVHTYMMKPRSEVSIDATWIEIHNVVCEESRMETDE